MRPFADEGCICSSQQTHQDKSKECGELVLAALLQFGIIDEKLLDRHPLQRVNEVVRRNQCGVLACMERDVADAIGYGPAGIGWPWVAAQNWISEMKKLGKQLEIERGKRIEAMREQDEKDQKHGEKMKQEREKMAAFAGKMKAANKKMTKIQEDAWVGELPSACLKAKAKIELFQWVYGMQCMENWILGEEAGEEDPIGCVAAGKGEKSKQKDQTD
ncbi:Uncharacterized protein SCF082_LOCUS16792 [Durusdinium trenchii]|uniref:Uncharacterized protein n=1 Tax=Durusdinium trenchii TaxID=1381693 RepID=A0ABP0KDA9_9DINO